VDAIRGSLKKGTIVTLVALARSMLASARSARAASAHGATIRIGAAKVPKFRAGKA